MVRLSALVLALVISVLACVAPAAEEPPPDPEIVVVAKGLCPLMWRWQLTVGTVMNDMSSRALAEPDPRQRRRIYLEALERIQQLNERLATDVTAIPRGPYAGLLMSDVLDGLAAADVVLQGLRTFVTGIEPNEDASPHDVIPVIFLDVEKVIDLPKPELATYHQEELVRAFVTVPQCQFGVKDADDGVPRYIPVGS